jgi:hypothetical protein
LVIKSTTKKLYRLKRNSNAERKARKPSKTYVKYRKVPPKQPFKVLEMDIKFVWIEEFKIRAYILTIDTFRVILARFTDYSIKKEDVNELGNASILIIYSLINVWKRKSISRLITITTADSAPKGFRNFS